MFENRRVYLLTGVAYMGAMLFGSSALAKTRSMESLRLTTHI